MNCVHLTKENMSKIFTDADFQQEVLSYKGLAVVDFYADWCGPCKMLAPSIEQLAEEYKDVKIGKMNIDENMNTAKQYDVMSIPTIIFFKDGQIAVRMVGMKSKGDLEAKIKELK